MQVSIGQASQVQRDMHDTRETQRRQSLGSPGRGKAHVVERNQPTPTVECGIGRDPGSDSLLASMAPQALVRAVRGPG